MRKLVCAAMLWEPNEHSFDFSTMYDETWVTRLYEGYKRNLTMPFVFWLFTDRNRPLPREIKQFPITGLKSYCALIEPFQYDGPMILTGLDTVITGNIDDLAEYCMDERHQVGLPRDPFFPQTICNGVALIPPGKQHFFSEWDRVQNDMDYLRARSDVTVLDDWFPGRVVSYKGHAKDYGPDGAGIVYFHGREKPHELLDVEWVQEAWRGECHSAILAS
jgi:hypothetical protein